MRQLTSKEQSQEDEYVFPYHYLSLYLGLYKNVIHQPYLTQIRTVKDMLGELNGQKLLDAGCGDGRFCYELEGEHVKRVGIDYSERAIAFARAFNPSVEFHLGDLTDLQFNEEFDIVTMLDVLEHLPSEIITKAIVNLWKALKPGGRLVVSVPTTNMAVPDKHYQHFSAETLEKLFVPMFEPVAIRGYIKSGRKWRTYSRLQGCAKLIWPLHNKMRLVRRFVKYMDGCFAGIVDCDPDAANEIIEIFEKKR